MGNACCGEKKDKKKIVLLLVGLDNAGKTVAAKGLAGESINDIIPTVGFHCVKLKYKNFNVKVYDLGGAANFRGLWPKYFVDAYGIIFVIDSSDIDRLEEAKQVLESVLSHEKVSGKPLLFLANKQDDENALDEIDLHEKFNLEDVVNRYHCPTLVECCTATYSDRKAKIDSGILNGFKWLMNFIDKNYLELNTRVVADILQQEQVENRLRDAIIKRIREAKELEESNDENVIELYSEYAKKMDSHIKNGSCIPNLKKDENSFEDEFPPVYYGTVQQQSIQRPSSAREFVRNQLQLNCNGVASNKINRTLPFHLIGIKLPSSAKERSKTSVLSRRILKSAGDINTSVQLPNMVFLKETGNDAEGFDMRIFNKNCQFLPLDISPKVNIQNGISWSKSEDENEISFINIS